MGIFTKDETVTKVGNSFAEQLTAIKESFRTAYNKADALNQKIKDDMIATTAQIEVLQMKLNESAEAKVNTEEFMKNLEKFI